MNDPIITVENLGKRYSLRHQTGQRYTTLRDAIAHSVTAPFRRWRNGRRSKVADGSADLQSPNSNLTSRASREDFWALKDVSFEV